MIELTKKAAIKFEEIRFRQKRPTACMRLAVLSGDCAGLNYHVGLDEFRASDDFAIKCKGIQILVDETSLQYIWGSRIEWMEVDGDAGFVIFNPNKGRSAGGCGKNGMGCMTKGDGKTCISSSKGCSNDHCSSACNKKNEDLYQIIQENKNKYF
ncbi:MAG: iron-sulfur cluster assembly accessory protein [Candidatus Omnitrophota bacterium]|jgi:iron-sulfur cluster assembly accessory protein|nr:MAG: iron-sulfur cluster assembly accessory protein [Candidatus Omnitrophota bacterium]